MTAMVSSGLIFTPENAIAAEGKFQSCLVDDEKFILEQVVPAMLNVARAANLLPQRHTTRLPRM